MKKRVIKPILQICKLSFERPIACPGRVGIQPANPVFPHSHSIVPESGSIQ